MKRYLILVASCLVSASTLADQVLGEVEDKYVTKVRNIPVTTEQCKLVRVPIYAGQENSLEIWFWAQQLGLSLVTRSAMAKVLVQ
jgi:hypothetical protein